MGNIHGNSINVDVLERNGSTYRSKPAPDFLQGQRRLVHAGFAKDRARRLPLRARLVRPLSLLPRRQPRPRRYRPAEGAPVPRALQGDPAATPGLTLAKSDIDGLLDLLGSPNVYDREIAQRILTERDSPSIREKLEAIVLNEKKPRTARMHGLWARVGIGSLAPEFHARLLSHGDPTVSAPGACVRRVMREKSTPR